MDAIWDVLLPPSVACLHLYIYFFTLTSIALLVLAATAIDTVACLLLYLYSSTPRSISLLVLAAADIDTFASTSLLCEFLLSSQGTGVIQRYKVIYELNCATPPPMVFASPTGLPKWTCTIARTNRLSRVLTLQWTWFHTRYSSSIDNTACSETRDFFMTSEKRNRTFTKCIGRGKWFHSSRLVKRHWWSLLSTLMRGKIEQLWSTLSDSRLLGEVLGEFDLFWLL
jgi:hypothetical protein